MSIKKALHEVANLIISFPQEQAKYMKEVSNFALNRGWYLNHIYLFVLNIDECKDESFDDKIIELINDEYDSYEELLHHSLPHRSALWKEIDLCLKNDLYNSVIHLCFSQADGIFYEKFGDSLYKNSFNVAKEQFSLSMNDVLNYESLSAQVGYFKDGSVFSRMFNEVYLNCLNKKTSELYINTKKITENNISLPNRHGVMHGVHFQYGTKVNAYKALAFMQFILLAIHGEELGVS